MPRNNLKKTKYNVLYLNLQKYKIYSGKVVANSKSCSKIHTPSGWEGKEVLVVAENG
jgi:hypothetical protein